METYGLMEDNKNTLCRIHKYLDNTVLYRSAKWTEECQQALVEDVERSALWFRVTNCP